MIGPTSQRLEADSCQETLKDGAIPPASMRPMIRLCSAGSSLVASSISRLAAPLRREQQQGRAASSWMRSGPLLLSHLEGEADVLLHAMDRPPAFVVSRGGHALHEAWHRLVSGRRPAARSAERRTPARRRPPRRPQPPRQNRSSRPALSSCRPLHRPLPPQSRLPP